MDPIQQTHILDIKNSKEKYHMQVKFELIVPIYR